MGATWQPLRFITAPRIILFFPCRASKPLSGFGLPKSGAYFLSPLTAILRSLATVSWTEVFRIRILVISSCTSTKSKEHPEQLQLDDFRDPAQLAQRQAELRSLAPHLATPARDLYTGRQHRYVMEGVERLRQGLSPVVQVDLQIVSAGYGLVEECELLFPYEATFNAMRTREAQTYARNVLHLPERIQAAMQGYDLVIVLLGESYLKTLDLANWASRPGMLIVAGTSTQKWCPPRLQSSLVPFTNHDVKVVGGGQVGLKGAIFKRLAVKLLESAEPIVALQRLVEKPQQLREILEIGPIPVQSLLPLGSSRAKRKSKPQIKLPSENRAANAGERPKFFVPDWDDLVNPLYDFITDHHPQIETMGGFTPLRDGWYAHEFFHKSIPYDGILISRSAMEEKRDWKQEHFHDAHAFLRFPKGQPIMGDCGAFSYLDAEVPPYSTEEVLAYYEQYGFDLGVSVDHLIVGKYAEDAVERERRWLLTISNAADFIRQHRVGNFRFTPMGIAQGWDIPSYKKAVANLLEMGYKHIAFGSLAYAKSQFVANLLAEVSPLFPADLYVHMFGLAREELLPAFERYGVTAFDSATFLRRSWLSAKDNYLDSQTGEWYTAIRVPPSTFTKTTKKGVRRQFHRRVKPLLESGTTTYEQIAILEQRALSVLRAYGRREATLDETLAVVLAYDELMMPGKQLEALYTRTLVDRPWERCDCPLCQTLGIEILIFRQNDRNRRRGFHNSYAFRQLEQSHWDRLQVQFLPPSSL